MNRSAWMVVLGLAVVVGTGFAAQDPWRVRITDLDPYGPFVNQGWVYELMIDDTVGKWGARGGVFRMYHGFGANWPTTGVVSFDAATGAVSFGTVTTTSIGGWGRRAVTNALKVGGIYKCWNRSYAMHGQEYLYSVSADGVNFSVPTGCTVYGSTVTNTGMAGLGPYRSTSGVYIALHGNSLSNAQGAGSQGIATSGVGETVWYDIDTLPADPVLSVPYGGVGDPIAEPHTIGELHGYKQLNDYQRLNRACDGNLFALKSVYNAEADCGAVFDMGLGLVIGTAGELCGGDHYVWLSDPDSLNTTGIAPSLLSGIGLPGQSGPSLRTHLAYWQIGWPGKSLPLKPALNEPATQFVVFYNAGWDTDSSGAGYDLIGIGRAKLLMTRNKGDLNYDGTVDFTDVAILSGSFGRSSGQSGYNAEADLNRDGRVDFLDAGILSSRYGTDCSVQN